MRINDQLHHKLVLMKFYSGLPMEIIAEALLEASLNPPFLETILMKLLADKKKVNHVLKYIEQNERIKR